MSGPPPNACVIGWPVKHSRSPLIHGYWLETLGIEGSYGFREVAPADFANFISNLAGKDLCGGNVTLPHKEMAFQLATRRTDIATQLQAVNTIWIEDGDLWGDNTDIAGFLSSLDAETSDWDKNGDKAIILGAGGAARAIVQALLQRNIKRITVINRTFERAAALASLFRSGVEALPWEQRSMALSDADILVNTTSLGMAGQPELDIDLALLPDHAVVDDIIYIPLETKLLMNARRRNLRCVGGLSMLLYQAVPGFERWFGQKPQVTPELRALIEADIRRASK